MSSLPLVLVLGLGLAACGGGGESDEDKIAKTIETSILSNDPAHCKKLATLQFLEQTQFSEGPQAVKSCEENAKESKDDAKSVEVTKVETEGSKATADAAFGGGTFDGQTFSVALVEADGGWKLDEITGFARLDQDKLARSLEREFASGEEAAPAKVASCLGEEFREMPATEFEGLIIGGDPQPLTEIIEDCQQR